MGQDDKQAAPNLRYRNRIGATIETLKQTVAYVHLDASTLSGRKAKDLREIADDMDAYAELLKERLRQVDRI